jgi:preprotein translocase subunit SecB
LKTNEPQKRMDPTAYREFLSHVDLKNIVLDSCTVKTNRDKIAGNMKMDIKNKVDYVVENNNLAIIISRYNVVATRSTQKESALKIECIFRVELSSDQPITEDFLDIFTKVNLYINTWPYLREFVQSTIQRIGYPPLTLPLLKPHDKPPVKK